MLYFRIDNVGQFARCFPRSENYSIYGLEALMQHYKSKDEDISVNEELDYSSCEYDSARAALGDKDKNALRGIELELAWEALEEAGEDPEENAQLLELWADDADPEEVEEKALEYLKRHYSGVYPLRNSAVLIVED